MIKNQDFLVEELLRLAPTLGGFDVDIHKLRADAYEYYNDNKLKDCTEFEELPDKELQTRVDTILTKIDNVGLDYYLDESIIVVDAKQVIDKITDVYGFDYIHLQIHYMLKSVTLYKNHFIIGYKLKQGKYTEILEVTDLIIGRELERGINIADDNQFMNILDLFLN